LVFIFSREGDGMLKDLFEQALGLESPWHIKSLNFNSDSGRGRLDIHIDFSRGAKFEYVLPDGTVASGLSVHDTVERRWRHLNFFQHECFLVCRVPRVKLPDGKVRMIKTPWEGRGLGFTMLFEALMLQLCTEMPVNAVARLMSVDDNKIWRILKAYVAEARGNEDYSELRIIGIDETSMKRNHNYVSIVVDLEKAKTVFVAEGKDSQVLNEFKDELRARDGDPERISDISCDMSPAFIKGIGEHFPNSAITFDKFHIMKLINEAVGEVRKKEARENHILKGTKNLFERNRINMSEKQLEHFQKRLELRSLNLKTVRAYHIKEAFQEIYKKETRDEFEKALRQWYSWARRCRLEPMKEVADVVKRHWGGVLRWFDSRITNGLLEGLNSLIQSAKAKARGFKTFANFSAVIYLITGKLDFSKVNPYYRDLKNC